MIDSQLTSREREILLCLADGLSNQEIADKMHLAEKTVRWYNTQIFSKLGVVNRREAVKRAEALGLLNSPPDSPKRISRKDNLPAQATPFVGRQNELGEVIVLLNDANTRLITILAHGGMGKTRLALEAARNQIGRYADGVYFVPLAPLGSTHDIVTTIAENVSFSFYGEKLPTQQLMEFLEDRTMLLVLDNFEHLLDGAGLLADLLKAAPRLRVLITSRERLNLQGETVYSLRGLEFPTWETPADAMEYDAVKLFMQSAHRVRPEFEIHADNLDYLARICRLTAGMPLGIELAAGWVDVMTLEQIAAEIQKGVDILETEMRDMPERHRSIRATFERSWEQLNRDEQRAFMGLSVFWGGFTLEAAQAVADADVRLLRRLTNKSLVQAAPDSRHDIHELLRQFGAEKLAGSGELPAIQAKHAAFFADFMAERKQEIKTDRQLEALELIDPAFENVRVAWLYLVKQQSWEQLPKFLHSLWFYCDVRTRGREALELLEHTANALRSAPSSVEIELALGRVLARLGWFYGDAGFWQRGADISDEAIRILRQHDSPEDLIAALHERQNTANALKQSDIGLSISKEAIGIARSIGDKSWEGHLLIWSGWIIHNMGDSVSALKPIEEGLLVFEAVGDRWGLHRTYYMLGDIEAAQENPENNERAKHWLQQAQTLGYAFGHQFDIAVAHTSQAMIALHEKNYADSRAHLSKALHVLWDAGYKWFVRQTLVWIAQMLADQNKLDRAVEILAVAQEHTLFNGRNAQVAQTLRHELESRLEPDRFAAAWVRGQQRELSAVVAELLAEFAEK